MAHLNLSWLSEKISNRQSFLEWLHVEGFVPTSRNCPHCNKVLSTKTDALLGRFHCQRKAQHDNNRDFIEEVSKSTWFEGTKQPAEQVMIITYCFVRQHSLESTIHEASITSKKIVSLRTVVEWFCFCREMCLLSLEKKYHDEGKMGGSGSAIEVKTCIVGNSNCKVNRILGIFNRETSELRLEICPRNKRDYRTLEKLINKHVHKGSTIHTECWRGYNGLAAEGFVHRTVKNKLSSTSLVALQLRLLKRRIMHISFTKDNLVDHLAEFMWRQECKRREVEPFRHMLDEIKLFFPGEQ